MTIINAGDIQALRKAGLTVHEAAGWEHRGHGAGGPVNGMVIHHTAGPKSGNFPSEQTLIRGRADLQGPLANFGLARDGSLTATASGVAWHAGAVRDARFTNTHTIGVEVEASGYSTLTKAQRATLVLLGVVMAARKGFKAGMIRGHREVCYPKGRKIDPRYYSMTALRLAVGRYKAPKKAAKAGPVAQVKALQGALGFPQAERDGIWGPATDRAAIDFRHLAKAHPGPRRKQIAAVQRALGLTPLPVPAFGPRTDRAFTALRSKAHV